MDAAECVNRLPDIFVTIEELNQASLNSVKGVESRQRINEKLYLDYTTDKLKSKRPPPIDLKTDQTDGLLLPAPKEDKRGTMYYKVTVKDNGSGMSHEDIPNMFGRGKCFLSFRRLLFLEN